MPTLEFILRQLHIKKKLCNNGNVEQPSNGNQTVNKHQTENDAYFNARIILFLAENCNPYCLLNIYHPLKRNGSFSPKSSPKTSPKSSPKLKKLSATLPPLQTNDTEEILRTHTAKHTSEPQWNEEFEL